MKTFLVALMILVFAHHPTRPECYVAPVYRDTAIGVVMVLAPTKKG